MPGYIKSLFCVFIYISTGQKSCVSPCQVGKQTVESSKDELLKKDMPPSFVTVHDACSKLQTAAEGLNADHSSQTHHVLLLEGARGQYYCLCILS